MEEVRPKRIAIIGGGISGLAAAQRLISRGHPVELRIFESANRLGGVLFTERRDGFLIEHSADMFSTQEPWCAELCANVGLTDELVTTVEQFRRAFVIRGGRLHPVPEGFAVLQPQLVWPILRTSLLSPLGKLRLLGEYFVPARRDEHDESLADFARRRFGEQAYERLIQPLVGGIYTADPTRLSMQATLNRFVKLEREQGSLIRAALRTRKQSSPQAKMERAASGARYSMFVAPRDGLSRLVDAIHAHLPVGSVMLKTAVHEITRLPAGCWQLRYEDLATAHVTTEDFDAVIVATPADTAATLLHGVHAELAQDLRGIPLAGAAIVMTAFRRDQIAHPLNGFGAVAPLKEQRKILSTSFASVKFPGRAPDGHVLLRTFVGGACQPELLELSDSKIEQLVLQELSDLLGARGTPALLFVKRWHGTMPQYHVGHLERVARIEQYVASLPNLALAGNAYRGVGIPFCVRSGYQAADSVGPVFNPSEKGT